MEDFCQSHSSLTLAYFCVCFSPYPSVRERRGIRILDYNKRKKRHREILDNLLKSQQGNASLQVHFSVHTGSSQIDIGLKETEGLEKQLATRRDAPKPHEWIKCLFVGNCIAASGQC